MALIRVFIGKCDVIGMEFYKGSGLVTLGPVVMYFTQLILTSVKMVCVCVCVCVCMCPSVCLSTIFLGNRGNSVTRGHIFN